MLRLTALRLTAMALLACVPVVHAFEIGITPRSRPRTGAAHSIRVESRLVLIPVTVTDPLGAPVAGLRRSAFRLFEGGSQQEIKYFHSEDAPVSLGVVFDASQSMEGRIGRSREALARFFETAVPGDEYFVVEFNDRPRLLCEFTPDAGRIRQALAGIKTRNWTALLDAVCLAVQQMKHAKNARKALLVLSDGGDNNSRYTETEMLSILREGDVSVYSIGLAGGLLNRHVRLLRKLSDETGGHVWEVGNAGELPGAVLKASTAIRLQYVLGYPPVSSDENGLYHKVQVKVDPPENWPALRASWRSGYYGIPGQ
jgi:Ca-activated chloride channel homolog